MLDRLLEYAIKGLTSIFLVAVSYPLFTIGYLLQRDDCKRSSRILFGLGVVTLVSSLGIWLI